MISALSWMPRGKAKAVPVKYEPSAEEMEEMRQTAKEMEASGAGQAGGLEEESDEWEDMEDDEEEETREEAVDRASKAAKSANKSAQKAPGASANDLAEYNLDDYDNEPDGVVGVLAGAGLAVYSNNNEDPYITLPDADDDSENDEENMIRPSDSIILACHSEEDGHMLDVYVYDDEEGSLFVHHDLMLNAFPLCVAYTDTARKGTAGNYVAIGTMDTEIEVWDLDCIDSMTPVACLGGEDRGADSGPASKGKKKKKVAAKVLKEGSHKDAVLGLAWHHQQRHIMASASADKTVKIWDVPNEKCLHTLTHHQDKVQGLQWHPTDAAVLLTGSFDRTAAVLDVRATASDWKAAGKWPVSDDIECVQWDPTNPHRFFVSTDAGNVTCHDARHQGQGPVFTIGAHTEACTGLALNPHVPGLLATSSLDKTVKIWDFRGDKVDYVVSKAMDVGQVFCCSFCGDAETPWILAIGGKDSKLFVWDVAASTAVRRAWATGKSDAEYAGAEEDLGLGNMRIGKKEEGRDSDDDSSTDEEEEEEVPVPQKKPSAKKKASKGK
mmetsp:Transcript_48578/g.115634  ORF Transcript_48578/g.115634 Transcript_48578/m.115634 type:complete len:553 (+) Transcript_48578:54-1712(+)